MHTGPGTGVGPVHFSRTRFLPGCPEPPSLEQLKNSRSLRDCATSVPAPWAPEKNAFCCCGAGGVELRPCRSSDRLSCWASGREPGGPTVLVDFSVSPCGCPGVSFTYFSLCASMHTQSGPLCLHFGPTLFFLVMPPSASGDFLS